MKRDVSFALNKLKTIYERLNSIDDENIFPPVLEEFYIEIITIIELKNASQKLNQKYNRFIASLKDPEKAALDEMETVYSEICNFVKQENLQIFSCSEVLMEALSIFKDPSIYQAGHVDNKIIAMNMIMISLYMTPKGKKCKYAIKPVGMKSGKEYFATNLKTECLLPKTWDWHEKRLALYDKNEMRKCMSLKKIEDFFNCYNTPQYEKIKAARLKNSLSPKQLHECHKSFSVGTILGIKKSYYDSEFEAPRPFIMQEFKQHAGRVFWAIHRILHPKHNITFDISSGIFKYNDEDEIEFDLNTPSGVILSLLITQTGPRKIKYLDKKSILDAIYNSIKNLDEDPDLYEVYRAINKRISNAYGLKNFLIYKNETIRINPLYLD